MTTSIAEIFDKLSQPFSQRALEWKVGRKNQDRTLGIALPFLKFQAVASRLDEVLGPQNWDNTYKPGPAGGVVCNIRLRIDGEWLSKENGAENTDYEPVKGGLSDAFKRAAVMWGIGRYLYNYRAVAVPLDENQRMMSLPLLPDELLPVEERGQQQASSAHAEYDEANGEATQTNGAEGTTTAEETGSTVVSSSDDNLTPETKVEETSVEETKVEETPPASNVVSLTKAPVEKPAATAPAAVVEAAPAAVADSTVTDSQPAGGATGMPEGLPDDDIAKITEILARARKNVSISALKSYVAGKTKGVMTEPARQYLMQELDKFAA